MVMMSRRQTNQLTMAVRRGSVMATILILTLVTSPAVGMMPSNLSVMRLKRQITDEASGLRITDLWLKLLFDWFPNFFPGQLMTTPVLFMPQIKRIPGQLFQMLNLPIPTYAASTSSYDLTNIVKSVFGVDIFTLMFITMLYILASLALVSIVLPNIYFRLLLWADSSSQDVMASIYDEYDDYDLDYNLLY